MHKERSTLLQETESKERKFRADIWFYILLVHQLIHLLSKLKLLDLEDISFLRRIVLDFLRPFTKERDVHFLSPLRVLDVCHLSPVVTSISNIKWNIEFVLCLSNLEENLSVCLSVGLFVHLVYHAATSEQWRTTSRDGPEENHQKEN